VNELRKMTPRTSGPIRLSLEWRLLEQTLNVSLPMAQNRPVALESWIVAKHACDLEDVLNRGSQDLEIDETDFL
jgi:hypothetical protein